MFKGPYGLQNQSSNLLYKSHKTLPDGAPFDFSSLVSQYPLSYRFCPSNTRFLVTSAVGQTVFHLCVFTHPFLCLEYFPAFPHLAHSVQASPLPRSFPDSSTPIQVLLLQAARTPCAYLALFTYHAATLRAQGQCVIHYYIRST